MNKDDMVRQTLMSEQGETARELAQLLRLGHVMARRLSKETQGDLYNDVRLLNELLAQVREQAEFIDMALNNDTSLSVAELLNSAEMKRHSH